MRPGGRGKATAAAAATGVQVGAAMVGSRLALEQLGVAELALLRYALALLLVLPAALATRAGGWSRRDVLPVGLLGVLQFGVVILLLNLSLQRLPAGLAALLFTTAPLQALLLAAAFGQERLGWAKAIGALVAVAGVAVALGARLPAGAGLWAPLAALGSAFAAALCSVLYRPYLTRYPAPQVGAVAMTASVVVLLVPAVAAGLGASAWHLRLITWEAVAFVGASSGAGYLLWLWALQHAEASRVTLFLALGPIAAMVLGAALLGEGLTARALAGALLVALGVAVAQRAPQTAPATAGSG